MNELELKYGCNPNQKPSRIFMENGADLPIEVLNGKPGYINFLDAFNSWQLVSELKAATGLPAAASFKHVSPAGAAVATELSDTLKKIYFVDDLELSPIASAYAKARGADRMSSYGDWAALSDVCDKETALILKREVSDGIIAPGYTDEALEILKSKRRGTYNIVKIDPNYVPAAIEHKQVYGITFEQGRNSLKIDEELLKNFPTDNKTFTDEAKRDLIIALITLKYTQSNSVCYAKDGQVSSQEYTAQDLQEIRLIYGISARIQRLWHFLSRRIFAVLTVTILLMFIFLMITKMFLRTVSGNSSSQKSQNHLLVRRKRNGSKHSVEYLLVQTHSSHSVTILKELTGVV